MDNKRGFEVKYYGPTNTRGSRIRVKDLRNDVSKMIQYDYAVTGIYTMAENFLDDLGIEVEGCIETPTGYVLTSDNFETMIK